MQNQSKLPIGTKVNSNFLLVVEIKFFSCLNFTPFLCESIFLQFRKCCLITPKVAMFLLTSLLWSNQNQLGFLKVGLVSIYINPSLVQVDTDVNSKAVGCHSPCAKRKMIGVRHKIEGNVLVKLVLSAATRNA